MSMRHVMTLLMCGVVLGPAAAQEAGPEVGGLRLKLTVKHPPAVPAGKHELRVELRNASKKAIDLVARFERDGKQTYKDWFASNLSLRTRPATDSISHWAEGADIRPRTAPQPKVRLEPGKAIVHTWLTDDRLEIGGFSRVWTTPGLYQIRAQFMIGDPVEGDYFILESNEQPFIVGGSVKRPKTGVGKLTRLDTKKKWAEIDLGAHHMIAVGDRFSVRWRLPKGRGSRTWTITVTDVSQYTARGSIALQHQRRDGPDWPKTGWRVVFSRTAPKK